MNLTLGLLADFANKSADGKLNVLGAFNRIFAERYPAIHPEMKLVLRFELHPAEAGQTKQLQIQLRDDQGRQIFELAGELNVPAAPEGQPRGEMLYIDSILGLNNFPIEAPGRHRRLPVGYIQTALKLIDELKRLEEAKSQEGRREP